MDAEVEAMIEGYIDDDVPKIPFATKGKDWSDGGFCGRTKPVHRLSDFHSYPFVQKLQSRTGLF